MNKKNNQDDALRLAEPLQKKLFKLSNRQSWYQFWYLLFKRLLFAERLPIWSSILVFIGIFPIVSFILSTILNRSLFRQIFDGWMVVYFLNFHIRNRFVRIHRSQRLLTVLCMCILVLRIGVTFLYWIIARLLWDVLYVLLIVLRLRFLNV